MNMNTLRSPEGIPPCDNFMSHFLAKFPEGECTLEEGISWCKYVDRVDYLQQFICSIVVKRGCPTKCVNCIAYTTSYEGSKEQYQSLTYWFGSHNVEQCTTRIRDITVAAGRKDILS